jgi:hypothetical protein
MALRERLSWRDAFVLRRRAAVPLDQLFTYGVNGGPVVGARVLVPFSERS